MRKSWRRLGSLLALLPCCFSAGQTILLSPDAELLQGRTVHDQGSPLKLPIPASSAPFLELGATSLDAAAPTSVVPTLKPVTQLAPQPSPPVPMEGPMQAFLYIEPYQTRLELMLESRFFLKWLNPIKTWPEQISAEAQKSIITSAANQVRDFCRFSANGMPIEGQFLGVSVIKGRPGATLPMAEGESISLDDAMFGITWEFNTPPSPDEVRLEWRGFIGGARALPVRLFFGNSSEVLEASPMLPKVTWKAQGRLPLPRALAPVPEIVLLPSFMLPLASIIWVLGGLAFFSTVRLHDRHLPGGYMPFFFTLVLGAIMTYPLLNLPLGGGLQVPVIQEKKEAEAIVTPLLRNVYRAFDHRTESAIYDVLARSVEGDLLRQLYLETIQALTLEGREGTRVTISEFSADILKVTSLADQKAFRAECQWTAMGNVGHWGHYHTRVNRYNAEVTVNAIGQAWKITQLEVREARRL